MFLFSIEFLNRIGISDLIMNNENGVETLTNSDKDKANTLSDFFSSVFTTETTDKYPSLEVDYS
jgi:hypothetical protein